MCKTKQKNQQTVLLENSDSIDTVPEDAGLWKQTAFSDKWWAARAPVKGTVNTKQFAQGGGWGGRVSFSGAHIVSGIQKIALGKPGPTRLHSHPSHSKRDSSHYCKDIAGCYSGSILVRSFDTLLCVGLVVFGLLCVWPSVCACVRLRSEVRVLVCKCVMTDGCLASEASGESGRPLPSVLPFLPSFLHCDFDLSRFASVGGICIFFSPPRLS